MSLLILYILLAVLVSFLCSIAEAVILSVSTSYIASAERDGRKFGPQLRNLKDDINSPLAVILTLNTVAHTVGAAGAGAQAAMVFGSVYVGVFSAVLTLIILVFSEIIPKALGAHYWRQLAPAAAGVLSFLVKALYPFVVLSNVLTRQFQGEKNLQGFSRKEFAAMADLGHQEGQLEAHEAAVLQNLLNLREMKVRDVMTPRSVMFSMDENCSIDSFFEEKQSKRYSRVPIYSSPENITGFVLRGDLLAAQAAGKNDAPLANYRREMHAVIDATPLLKSLETMVGGQSQILLVVDEYGGTRGLITLEDILETLLGLEIMDESDTVADLQAVARRLGTIRKKKMGLD